MASFITTAGKAAIKDGTVRWAVDDLWVRLMADTEGDPGAAVTSMTGIGQSSTDTPLTGRTVTANATDGTVSFDAADVTVMGVTSGVNYDRAIVFKKGVNDAASLPVMISDAVAALADGRAVLVRWDAGGVMVVTIVPPDTGGGVYAPASYTRAGSLTTALTDELANFVPRNATTGAPDAGGRMYVVGIGMSNAEDYHDELKAYLQSDPFWSVEKDAGLYFFRGSQSGHTAKEWDDVGEAQWTYIVSRLAANGGSFRQVLHIDAFMTNAFPATNGVMTSTQVQAIVANAKYHFPNLISMDFHSIAWTGLSTGARAPLWSVHSDDALLATQVGLINGVLVDYVQVYAEGSTYNSQFTFASDFPDGINWVAADFMDDGVHPTVTGAQKMARWVLNRWYNDAVKAWMWA